jgi:hypothetical protein
MRIILYHLRRLLQPLAGEPLLHFLVPAGHSMELTLFPPDTIRCASTLLAQVVVVAVETVRQIVVVVEDLVLILVAHRLYSLEGHVPT